MNLTLGFPDPEQESSLTRRAGFEVMLRRLEEWMAQTDSPIRAIRHEPAKPGEFADGKFRSLKMLDERASGECQSRFPKAAQKTYHLMYICH